MKYERTIRVRTRPKSPGQLAYEADCSANPSYHDGTMRKSWSQLSEPEKDTWERDPHPRNWSALSSAQPTDG